MFTRRKIRCKSADDLKAAPGKAALCAAKVGRASRLPLAETSAYKFIRPELNPFRFRASLGA